MFHFLRLAATALLVLASVPATNGQTTASPGEVRLNVSVLDRLNRSVAGLEPEHFRISEARAAQRIGYFAQTSAPLCLAVILDPPGNAALDTGAVRKALANLLKAGNAEDQIILMEIAGDKVGIEKYTGRGPAGGKEQYQIGRISGLDRLDEAFYLAAPYLRDGKFEKKAVVLVSDATDAFPVMNAFESSDVQAFWIRRDQTLFFQLSRGQAYILGSYAELEYYLGLIHSDLRNQYVLGYRRGGAGALKIERLSVQLNPPRELPKMSVKIRKIMTRAATDLPK
jgi:hypothetical protein